MRLELRIEFPTPSANALVNRVRGRAVYRQARRVWLSRVHSAYWQARQEAGRRRIWISPPGCKVRVTIERLTRQADALDYDGLVGGCKPLVDALVKLDLLDDDNPRNGAELVYLQPKNPIRYPAAWTRITLERLDEVTS